MWFRDALFTRVAVVHTVSGALWHVVPTTARVGPTAASGKVHPMTTEDRELFVHCRDAEPRIVRASVGESLRQVFVRAGVVQENEQDEFFAFADGSDEPVPPDAGEGANDHQQDPIDPDLTVDQLDSQNRHVHCYGCRHVDVAVNFSGGTERRRFSPATTIDVATRWACRKFRLDAAAAVEYVLLFCETNTQPKPDKYLGELLAETTVICFDLVAEVTPQG